MSAKLRRLGKKNRREKVIIFAAKTFPYLFRCQINQTKAQLFQTCKRPVQNIIMVKLWWNCFANSNCGILSFVQYLCLLHCLFEQKKELTETPDGKKTLVLSFSPGYAEGWHVGDISGLQAQFGHLNSAEMENIRKSFKIYRCKTMQNAACSS